MQPVALQTFQPLLFYRARRESSAAQGTCGQPRPAAVGYRPPQGDRLRCHRHSPPFTRLIFDEGHHLEDVATSHLSLTITRSGILKQLQAGASKAVEPVSDDHLPRITRDLPESQEGLYAELSGLLESHLASRP